MKENFDDQMSAILAQGVAKPVKVEEKKFSLEQLKTKYFNPVIEKGSKATSATFDFRVIPSLVGGSPFQEVKIHTGLKLNGKWQKFICLSEYGEECPLCKTEEGLKLNNDKEEAKKYKTSDFFIVKGVDRAKSDDGVKFWRFKRKYDGTGEFDKIKTLFELFGNILHPETGYDLKITCGFNQKGYSTISSINCVKPSPLSSKKAVADAWLNDDSSWKDVYSKKSAEFLTQVVNGTAPYWDEVQKKMINSNQPAKVEEKHSQSVSNSVTDNPLLKEESFEDEVSDDDLPF